jgi:DNA polymerase-3 subunit epsilon
VRRSQAMILRIKQQTNGLNQMTNNTPTNAELENFAQILEAHPDFKVTRRFIERDGYSLPDGRELAKGVVIDTETTGLDLGEDKIIEIGMVAFQFDRETGEVFKILDAYNGLEDPKMPIPADSYAVHGISDAMVAGQRIDESRVAALVQDAEVIIAHNSGFDRPFLEARFPLFAKLAWGCSLAQINWKELGLGSLKLDYIAYRCGFFFEAHRAEADCRALLEILQFTLPDSGIRPLKLLIDRYSLKNYKVWANGSRFETKDVLKARAYRWDGDEKCWHTTVDESALDAELDWLKLAVYGGRSATVNIDMFDAYSRFSKRDGVRIKKVI